MPVRRRRRRCFSRRRGSHHPWGRRRRRIWRVPGGARRQIGRRRRWAGSARNRLIGARRAHAGTGTLRPDWCGKREHGNDRNAAQEMLHDFDPPLQFRIGRGISDAHFTRKRAAWVNEPARGSHAPSAIPSRLGCSRPFSPAATAREETLFPEPTSVSNQLGDRPPPWSTEGGGRPNDRL